jgi:hypothetical protein
MKKNCVICNFSGLSYADFLSKARSAQQALENPLFLSIVPTPAEVLPVIDQVQELWGLTNQRNYQVKAQRDRARDELETMLARQVYNVNGLAAGDLNVLRQSGFDLKKERSQRPVPSTPIIKGVTPFGDEGAVELSFIRPKGVAFFTVEVLDSNSKVIYNGTFTRSKVTLERLPVGVQLRARVRAENSTGKSVWTMPYPFIISVMDGVYGVYVFKTSKKVNNTSEEDTSVA